MVEAKFLLVQGSKPAGVPMPTAGRIDESCNNGSIFDAAEDERKAKEMGGTPAFGCGAGHSS